MNNYVTIVGNLTRDPETRFTPSGAGTTGFGVAVNRRWMNKTTQEWEEAVSFFDVVTWNDLASNVAETLRKGDRVIVTGRLEQRSWETDSGEKRYKIEIVADEVGPSLRWASAEITKQEKDRGERRPTQTRARSGSRSAPAVESFDEEPF